MPSPQEIEALTAEIEERKLEKQREREEKRELKTRKKKSELFDKLVAPILLFLTVLAGAIIWLL